MLQIIIAVHIKSCFMPDILFRHMAAILEDDREILQNKLTVLHCYCGDNKLKYILLAKEKL